MLEEKITMPPVLQGLGDENIAEILWRGFSKSDYSRDYSKDKTVQDFRKHIMGKTEWMTYDEVKKAVEEFTKNFKNDNEISLAKEGFKNDYSDREIMAIRSIMPTQISIGGKWTQDDLIDLSKVRSRYFVYTLERSQFKNVKFSALGMTDGKTIYTWPLAAIKNGAHTLVRNASDFKENPVMKTFDLKTWKYMVNNPKKFTFENIYVLSPKTKVPEEMVSNEQQKREYDIRFNKGI